MSANQADFPVRTLCRVLKASPSGFYAWQDRPPSTRAMADAVLTERIRQIHAASDGNYGSPNIHAELRDEGTRVGWRPNRAAWYALAWYDLDVQVGLDINPKQFRRGAFKIVAPTPQNGTGRRTIAPHAGIAGLPPAP